MGEFRGIVNGIDAQATAGQEPRCQAFINEDERKYIQVTTTWHNLQNALELACIMNVEVEVYYTEENGQKILNRVRLLDRE